MVHLQRPWKDCNVSSTRNFFKPPKVSIPILTVTALLPVVSWQTVVTFGPRGPVFTLTETCAVTPVMNRAHLVAVTLWKKRRVEKKNRTSQL